MGAPCVIKKKIHEYYSIIKSVNRSPLNHTYQGRDALKRKGLAPEWPCRKGHLQSKEKVGQNVA